MADEVSVMQANVIIRASRCGHHFDENCSSCHSALRWTDAEMDCLRDEIAPLRDAGGAILTLVNAMREYLPSDGISKDEFVDFVIYTLDNPEINPVIAELEGRT